MPAKAKDEHPTVLYDGKFIRLLRRGNWEYVTRRNISGIVGIVAITPRDELLLVEQFRQPVGARVIELPAGLAGDVAGAEGEALAEAARRELREETGYEAAEMILLAQGAVSAGLSDEIISFFLAKNLVKASDGGGDGSERITVHAVRVGSVQKWLEQRRIEGAIIDLKIFSGLYLASTQVGGSAV